MNTLPTSLVRFQSQLEEAVRDRARTPRRRVLRGGLVLSAAAAVALGVLSALPGDSPSVVERATAALQAGDDAILHTIVVATTTDAEGRTTVMRVEGWQAGSSPFDQRQITSTAGREVETATVNGVAQLYDPVTNTIYAPPIQPQVSKGAGAAVAKPSGPKGASEVDGRRDEKGDAARAEKAAAHAEPDGDAYRAKILSLLETGKIHEGDRVTVDGREAIRLGADDGSVALLVDAVSYQPIEWRVNEDGRAMVARFPTYERMPASDSNAALLSLAAQHPDATVDASPAAYESALQRLLPDKS